MVRKEGYTHTCYHLQRLSWQIMAWFRESCKPLVPTITNRYHRNCFYWSENHSFTVTVHMSSKGFGFPKGHFPLRIQPSPGNMLPFRLGVGLEAAGEIDVKVGIWSSYLGIFIYSERRDMFYACRCSASIRASP